MTKVTTDNYKIGLKVIRGPHWQYGTQDEDKKGNKLKGKIKKLYQHGILFGNIWVVVEWENGNTYSYRIGPENYDLYIYENNNQLEFEF